MFFSIWAGNELLRSSLAGWVQSLAPGIRKTPAWDL